jgi:hypothetical protein
MVVVSRPAECEAVLSLLETDIVTAAVVVTLCVSDHISCRCRVDVIVSEAESDIASALAVNEDDAVNDIVSVIIEE